MCVVRKIIFLTQFLLSGFVPQLNLNSYDLFPSGQDAHGRAGHKVRACGRFYRLPHQSCNVEVVLGKASVLEFVKEHDNRALLPVGYTSRQPDGFFFRNGYPFLSAQVYQEIDASFKVS